MILNLDEFAKEFNDITIKGGASTEELEKIIQEKLDQIIELLKQLLGTRKPQFYSMDLSKHIPAVMNAFIISKIADRDMYLTGITFSQTAWKVDDTITLECGGNRIIDEIHTKELGQYKGFNTFIPVKEGEVVRILYNNASGNSKMFLCDLDYICK